MLVISVFWKEFQKIDGECRQYTHSQHTLVQYSLFTSAERIARAWLKNCFLIFVRLKRICHLVCTSLTFCCRSPAVHVEHIIIFIHSSFCHDTRTRSTTRTTRSCPRNTQDIMHIFHALPIRQAAPSRITLRQNLQRGATRARQLPQSSTRPRSAKFAKNTMCRIVAVQTCR